MYRIHLFSSHLLMCYFVELKKVKENVEPIWYRHAFYFLQCVFPKWHMTHERKSLITLRWLRKPTPIDK